MINLLYPSYYKSSTDPSIIVDDPTRANLSQALQDVEDGGVIHIASGIYDIEGYGDPIPIDRSVTLNLNGSIFNVVEDGAKTASHLFNIQTGDDAKVLVFGGQINGPLTSNDGVFCFNWIENNTPGSLLAMDEVIVTGQYGYVIHRAGGGHMIIHNCDFDAYEGCIAFFGNNSEHGHLGISDSTLSCTNGKSSSIGIYIHPHFNIQSARNVYQEFNRYGIYCNGSPQGDYPVVSSIDDTFIDCDIIQVTHESTAYIANATVTGSREGSGTLIRGDAFFLNLNYAAEDLGITTLSNDYDHQVTFVDSNFDLSGLEFGWNGAAGALIRYINCNFNLLEGENGIAFTTHGNFTGTIDMGNSVITDHGTTAAWLLQTQGACTLDWNRCVIYSNKSEAQIFSQIDEDTTVIGAPTILPFEE